MKKCILITYLISSLLNSLNASEQKNPKSSSYFEDLGNIAFDKFTERTINTATTNTPKIKAPIKISKKIVSELNNSYDEIDPNSIRDAVINAAIKTIVVTIATTIYPPTAGILLGSNISDVHNNNYNPMAYLPSLESDDYVDQYIANSIGSFSFECGAAPYKVYKATATYLAKYAIKGCDKINITDASIKEWYGQKKSDIKKIADKVHKKFEKAPVNIKQMYQDFLDAPKEAAGNSTHPTEAFKLNPQDKQFIAELINEHTKETTQQLNTVTAIVTSLKKDNLVQQEREKVEQQIILVGDYAKATGDGLALLARFMNDRESEQKLKAWGTGVQKCITSAALMSTNPVLGGIGMANTLCEMIDAFEEKPEDTFKEEFRESIKSIHLAIFEAVKILSKIMMECTEATIGEIKKVKQLIGEQHGSVMQEFFKLHQGQNDTQKQMHTLYTSLIKGQDFAAQHAHQEHTLAAQRHEEIGGLFAELPVRHIDLEYHDLTTQTKHGLSADLLLKTIIKYHSFINVLATSSSLTGSYIAQDNPQRMAEALQGSLEARSLSTHPTFSHIDLLIHMHEKFLKRTLSDDLKTGIANPLILIKCAKQLTTLINDFCSSTECIFTKQQDKELCMQMLTDIKNEIERNQQIMQWLVHPSSSQLLLPEYKKAIDTLKITLDEHTKEHYETKIRTEMKDRLRSIAESELEILNHAIVPLFPKLKAELMAFDQSMTTAMQCFNSQAIGACYPRNAYCQGFPAVDCEFSPSLANIPNIETEAKREDFLTLTEQIVADKKKHWARVRQILQQHIKDNLKKNLAHIDTINVTAPSWIKTTSNTTARIQSVAYPSQIDHFNFPLIAVDLWKAPENIITLVAHGKATLRATYSVSGKRLTVTGWFKHNDCEQKVYEWVSPEHTDILETDEDIYNFWYGGRYTTPTDTITVKEHACSFSWAEQSGGIIGTYRYPSPVEQPGIYTKYSVTQSILEDATQKLVRKNAIDSYLAEKRSEQSRAAVQMLDDQTTDLGKASNKLNIFYALLGSSLVMHDGTLEPHKTIIESTNACVKNSQELRTLLRDKPTQVAAALTALSVLTTQPVIFNGTHKLLIKQTHYLDKIRTALNNLTQAPVHILAAPQPLHSILPEDFMQRFSERFERLEIENRELKEQNAQVLAQNAQMLALLMALNEKK